MEDYKTEYTNNEVIMKMPKTKWTDPVLINDRTIIDQIHVQELRDAINSLEESLETDFKDVSIVGNDQWFRVARSLAVPTVTGRFKVTLSNEGIPFQLVEFLAISHGNSIELTIISSNPIGDGLSKVRMACPEEGIGVRYLEVNRPGGTSPLHADAKVEVIENSGWELLNEAVTAEIPEGYILKERDLADAQLQASKVRSDSGIEFTIHSIKDESGYVDIVNGENTVLRITNEGTLLSDTGNGLEEVLVAHDFDAIAQSKGVTLVTEFDTPTAGDITETITDTATTDVIATRLTEFDTPSAGQIQVTVSVTGKGSAVHVTTFDAPTAGDIQEVVT